MMTAVRYIAVLLLAGTGCDDVFNLATVEAPADGAGSAASELPSFCTTPEVFDAFDTATVCPFGVTFEGAALDQHDGVLDINSDGARELFAGCTAFREYPFTERGVFLRVLQPLTVDHGYMRFTVRETFQTSPPMSASFLLADGELQFIVDGATVATRSDVPEWWRIRMLGDTPIVIAEVSADGESWQPWGSAQTERPASIAVDFGAGIDDLPSPPGKAVLGAFGICN